MNPKTEALLRKATKGELLREWKKALEWVNKLEEELAWRDYGETYRQTGDTGDKGQQELHKGGS